MSADIPGGVARQFARWVLHDAFDGNDGFDYRTGLKAVTVPVLAFAGAADFLATPASVHAARRFVGGPVETLTAGVAYGFIDDYGHGDLALGRHAPTEIVPRMAEYLGRFATRV
jgi:predicted alpha/beta hydrolase